jgi:bacillithiol biosynthesis deacetylase BshB1
MTPAPKLDILAIGIHPDDVELSCAGTLIKHIAQGKVVGICDLTRGEMGTRGTMQIRMKEAENAREIMGAVVRENLMMRDVWAEDMEDNITKIIQVIRKYRPEIVICNSNDERHPDHHKGSEMVKKACFLAGLPRIETFREAELQDSWRPKVVYHYIQAKFVQPDFVVDITGYMDQKIASIMAFESQFFNPDSKEPSTFISDQSFMDFVKAKDTIFGKTIGVQYAEGFLVDRYIGVNNLFDLI